MYIRNKQTRLSRLLPKMWKKGTVKIGDLLLQKPEDWRRNISITVYRDTFGHKNHFQLIDTESNETYISGTINGDLLDFADDNLEIISTQRILRLLQLFSDKDAISKMKEMINGTKLEITSDSIEKYREFTSPKIDTNLVNYLNKVILSKRTKHSDDITEKDILNLHHFIINNHNSSHLLYRKEDEFTFDLELGQISAWMPKWHEVSFLMRVLVNWLNSEKIKTLNPLLVAPAFQYLFLKIHPFADGNGRTIRSLIMLLLMLRAKYKISDFFLYSSKLGQTLQGIGIKSSFFSWYRTFGSCFIRLHKNNDKILIKKIIGFEENTRRFRNCIHKTHNEYMKKVILIIAFLTSLFSFGKAQTTVQWQVHNSHNNIPGAFCPVFAYRINPPATVSKQTNQYGRVTFNNTDFSPNLQIGENLILEAKKDTNSLEYKARTDWMVRSGSYPNHNYPLEVCLGDTVKPVKALTLNLSVVVDTSGWSTGAIFYALAWLYKNPAQVCTTQVDTLMSLLHKYDVCDLNLQEQDSLFTEGDSAVVKLVKQRGDTLLYTLIPFAIDTTHLNAQLIKSEGNSGSDTIFFPQSFSIFRDVCIDSLLLDSAYNYNQIITPQAKVRNLGTINQTPLIKLIIGSFYRDSIQQSITPGVHTLSFRPCTLNTEGTLLAVCKSILQGDTNTGNDSAYKNIRVREQEINDVGVIEILAPKDTTIYVGDSIQPRARVKNYSTTKKEFPTIISISDGKSNFVDTLLTELISDQESTLVFRYFQPLAAVSPAWIEARTNLIGDENPENDSLLKSFEVVESILPAAWQLRDSLLTQKPGKYVKDGGSITGISSLGKVMAFKGNNSTDVLFYHPEQDSFSYNPSDSMPYGYKPTDLTRINKKRIKKGSALCSDGINAFAVKGATNEFWQYNGLSWTFIDYVHSSKKLGGGTSLVEKDGKVYILAGNQKVGYDNFFVYDTLTKTFDTLATAPLGINYKKWKDGSDLAVLLDKIIAMKGGDKYNYINAYNPALDTWDTNPETIPLVHPDVGRKKKIVKGSALINAAGNLYAIIGNSNAFWQRTPEGLWIPEDTIPRLNRKSIPKGGADLAYLQDGENSGHIYLLKGNNTLEFWSYGPIPDTAGEFDKVSSTSIVPFKETYLSGKNTIIPTQYNSQYNSTGIMTPKEIRVYNALGQEVQRIYTDTQDMNNIELKGVGRGIYFLKPAGQEEKAQRIIVVK